jgi:gamma-glutamyltranspeptidase/glutathione hydrolase
MRDFEYPGRSLVMSTDGMAATSHPASTLAAVRVLEAGGNAMDAAIAACAVQCVVEPGSTGVGGDCFALYSRRGSDDIIGFNGSGWAPAAASVAALRAQGVVAIERHSPHAVTVPGAVDAWATLARDHGSLPLGQLLAPAIKLARDGYAVAPRAASDWAHHAQLLALDKTSRQRMLVDGKPPRAGTVHRQPLLARTLEAIAQTGARAFYEGLVAEDIVACLRSMGGLHTMDDFAQFRGEYVNPIKASFRGYDVHECPPNGQGIVALLILKILEGFDAHDDPLGADRLQREIEATRLAYAIRDASLGDPRGQPMDVDQLLSDQSIKALRARIGTQGSHIGGVPQTSTWSIRTPSISAWSTRSATARALSIRCSIHSAAALCRLKPGSCCITADRASRLKKATRTRLRRARDRCTPSFLAW